MHEEKLARLIQKFMALGEEFLELIRDLDLDYDDLNDLLDYDGQIFTIRGGTTF